MALTPTRDLYSFFLKEEGRFLSVTPWPRHEALPDGIRREECFLDEDGDGPSQEGELMSMRDKAFKEIKECRSFMGLGELPGWARGFGDVKEPKPPQARQGKEHPDARGSHTWSVIGPVQNQEARKAIDPDDLAHYRTLSSHLMNRTAHQIT